MHALTYHGRRDLRLEEIDQPAPGPGEVLIRVTECMLSQGMVDFNVEGHFADVSTPHPATGLATGFVLGQQFGGHIEAVGAGVDPGRVGELVAVAPAVGCGECEHCLANEAHYCDVLSYYGLVGAHGGMASHCAVRAECAVPIPGREFAATFEALLVVRNLLRKGEPWMRSGRPVLILGAGPVGLCAATLLRDLYDVESVLQDVLPGRLARAQGAGFRVAGSADLDSLFPLVLECAGTNPDTGGSAILDGLERVAKGGALMFAGTYLHEARIAPMDLLFREVTLGSSFAYSGQDVEDLAAALPKVRMDIDGMAERMSLEEAAGQGLLRGEVDRESFSALIVEP